MPFMPFGVFHIDICITAYSSELGHSSTNLLMGEFIVAYIRYFSIWERKYVYSKGNKKILSRKHLLEHSIAIVRYFEVRCVTYHTANFETCDGYRVPSRTMPSALTPYSYFSFITQSPIPSIYIITPELRQKWRTKRRERHRPSKPHYKRRT